MHDPFYEIVLGMEYPFIRKGREVSAFTVDCLFFSSPCAILTCEPFVCVCSRKRLGYYSGKWCISTLLKPTSAVRKLFRGQRLKMGSKCNVLQEKGEFSTLFFFY